MRYSASWEIGVPPPSAHPEQIPVMEEVYLFTVSRRLSRVFVGIAVATASVAGFVTISSPSASAATSKVVRTECSNRNVIPQSDNNDNGWVSYRTCIDVIRSGNTVRIAGRADLFAEAGTPKDVKSPQVNVQICEVVAANLRKCALLKQSAVGKGAVFTSSLNALTPGGKNLVVEPKKDGKKTSFAAKPGAKYRVFVTPVINGSSSYRGDSLRIWSSALLITKKPITSKTPDKFLSDIANAI
jgi:hypothetical protein